MRISLCSTYLWAHVEWCADVGAGEVVGSDDLGETKVAKLDTVIVAEKHCNTLIGASHACL